MSDIRCVEMVCTVCDRLYLAVPGAFDLTGCPYCVLQARSTRAAEQNLINPWLQWWQLDVKPVGVRGGNA